MTTPPTKPPTEDEPTRAAAALTDKKGLRVASAPDQAELDALFRALAPEVLRLLRGGFGFRRADGERGVFRVESAFDAEELCQEAFTAFCAQWIQGGYDRSRPAAPYLLRIAAHLALRRGALRAREPLWPVEALPPLPGPGPDPAQLTLRREAHQLAEDFYGELPPEDQAVFDACLRGNDSQAAAAATLGLSRDQVYRALARIRRRAQRFFTARGWARD